MSELKPCPFCGGEAKRGNMRVNGVLQHRVRCATCEAMSPLCDSEGEAEETWNRRDLTGNSRFADCHIWEPGDKLDTLSDKCDVLIKAADIKALVQPANEPLTCEGQWVEIASDNTDCVLTYADGIYCVTDADGHVICEFIRKPEPEGGNR